MHQIGHRVRNDKNGWYGVVLAVECLCCGKQLVDDKCPDGHFIGLRKFDSGREGWTYCITVAQDNVPGDARACCIPEYFPVVRSTLRRRTGWERVLEDPLVED
jgi:hypothetical protein